MKRFHFRLEGVLRLRRMQEEQAKESLSVANALLRHRLSARDVQAHRYRAVASLVAATTVEDFRSEQLAAELSAQALLRSEQAVAAAARDAALAQIAYTEAARLVAVIERLEERRRTEYVETEGRELVALTDDIVTARFVRDHFHPGGDAA